MPANANGRFSPFPYILILLAFAADRLSKRWAAAYLAQHGPTRVNEYLTLRATYNQGIAFGMFQGVGRLVGWLTIAVLVGLFIYQLRLPANMRWHQAGIALIIGGASGNLFDRVLTGKVLDFIQTPLPSGIFNVADLLIHLGLVLIVASALLLGDRRQAAPASKNERLENL